MYIFLGRSVSFTVISTPPVKPAMLPPVHCLPHHLEITFISLTKVKMWERTGEAKWLGENWGLRISVPRTNNLLLCTILFVYFWCTSVTLGLLWLCSQGSFLVVLRGPYMMPGIKLSTQAPCPLYFLCQLCSAACLLLQCGPLIFITSQLTPFEKIPLSCSPFAVATAVTKSCTL